jgi:hypothetical protein
LPSQLAPQLFYLVGGAQDGSHMSSSFSATGAAHPLYRVAPPDSPPQHKLSHDDEEGFL